MRILLSIVLLVLIAPAGAVDAAAQTGMIEVAGRVRIDGKQEKLSRKRFYLFNGSLATNKALVDRLKAAEIKSRDCYYTEQKASPQFICWLKVENCESPYCRKIKSDEVPKIPEFKAAYDANLKRPGITAAVALDWLTTSLPPTFSNGFYDERQALTTSLLGGVVPLQSAMTDTAGVRATLIDIPVTLTGDKKTQTFFVSNITPIEIGAKSYVWACEIEAGTEKLAKLILPEPGKTVRNCQTFVRELRTCSTGSCPAQ